MATLVPVDQDSRQVARIEINSEFTGGWDADGTPGDEGVAVLIEPRDEAGRLLRVVGPVSVVVLDPALPGQEARIARWDLTRDEVAAAFVRFPRAEGIYLLLPWREKVPVHSRLHLFVRFVTSDGRKLERDLPIEVTLGDGPGSNQRRPDGAWPAAIPPPASPGEPGSGDIPIEPRAARRVPQWSPIR
jgi:hypothetical protein